MLGACAEIDNLRRIKEIQDSRIQQLQTELETTNEQHYAKIRQLTSQLDAQEALVETTQSELTKIQGQYEREKNSTDRDMQRREDELVRSRQSTAELQETIVAMEREIASLKEANLALVQNVESTTKERAAALNEKDANIKDLESSLAKESARAEDQGKSVALLETQIAELKSKISGLEDAAKSEKEKTSAAEAQARKMQQGAAVLDDDLNNAYKLLKSSLKGMETTGFASVTTDARGVVVALAASDYLFQEGTVILDPQVAKPTLTLIADVYGQYGKKYVEVQGHTDAEPIVNMPFQDNWALASSRADAVVRYLATETKLSKMRDHLKSASCAQYRPLPSSSPNASKLVRRVEIILTPHP